MFIFAIPDFDIGGLVNQELHGAGEILIGRAVHGGLAIVVHGIDVRAEVQRYLHRLYDFALGSGGRAILYARVDSSADEIMLVENFR